MKDTERGAGVSIRIMASLLENKKLEDYYLPSFLLKTKIHDRQQIIRFGILLGTKGLTRLTK